MRIKNFLLRCTVENVEHEHKNQASIKLKLPSTTFSYHIKNLLYSSSNDLNHKMFIDVHEKKSLKRYHAFKAERINKDCFLSTKSFLSTHAKVMASQINSA
ncbi:CLUMA_CG006181, isoform A [Clunio marinus]|uniref:CLUMA_CG006181, isoform A n=1 Tax=Clunio marinus TaxID=568069 RepID=A0A1J1HYJ8_9DIPT|nr:CLUMA_CG006181, isoform A [Clunio marinus]